MKIALVENFGQDFYTARLRYSLFLKEKGYDVVAIIPNDGYAEKIQSAGIRVIALNIDVRKRSLLVIFSFAQQLRKIFKEEKFDIIHFYRLQPNLVGTSVAFLSSRKSKIINHITGLGIAFTKKSLKSNFMKHFIKRLYRINNRIFKATLIFQNEEDKREICNNDKNVSVIKGSSVNEDKFHPNVVVNQCLTDELTEVMDLTEGITLIFVSRLLRQKGLSYLIQAIDKINERNGIVKFNLLVAGWIDPNNPDSFTKEEIKEFSKINRVLFLGKRTDIDQLITLADIAVLPTFYREGTPRFLLEAMAIGKPILTTDMPGCNHLIINNTNGVLVKPKSVHSLSDGLIALSKENLVEMGRVSRLFYKSEFSEEIVFNQILKVYQR